jgi:hypothetical protein
MTTISVPLKNTDKVAIIDAADLPLVMWRSWRAAFDEHRVYVNSGSTAMHRLLLGAVRGQVVDHIDGNGLNNTRANIRIVTTAANAANARLSKRNKSGIKGVSRCTIAGREYWCCYVQFEGKNYKTTRATLEDAAAWVKAKRIEIHG